MQRLHKVERDRIVKDVIGALNELWEIVRTPGWTFYDLTCGDGIMLCEICRNFPFCRGVGVDLDSQLVALARAHTVNTTLQDRVQFHVGDIASVKLSNATVVFMCLPPKDVIPLLQEVFSESGLRQGVIIFSAGGPLPLKLASFQRLSFRALWIEEHGIFCYKWLGKESVMTADVLTASIRSAFDPGRPLVPHHGHNGRRRLREQSAPASYGSSNASSCPSPYRWVRKKSERDRAIADMQCLHPSGRSRAASGVCSPKNSIPGSPLQSSALEVGARVTCSGQLTMTKLRKWGVDIEDAALFAGWKPSGLPSPKLPAVKIDEEARSHELDSEGEPERQPQKDLLLPYTTRHLLCNWSPVCDTKLAALVAALGELWGNGGGAQESLASGGTLSFFDLGCGDGRVVLEVCKAFPECWCQGVDLNATLVEHGRASAKQRGLEDRCEFRVGDMVDLDLSSASVVFLYLPATALRFVLRRVFPRCRLNLGAIVFSADGPFPSEASNSLPRLSSRPDWLAKTDALGLYSYVWKGAPKDGAAVAHAKTKWR